MRPRGEQVGVASRSDRAFDEAQRQVVRELYAPLRRFAAVVGPREVEPDDLVQEAFFRVLRRGSLFDLDSPLAYLRATILNLASNHRRSLGRRNRALARLGTSGIADVTYPSDLSDLFALPPEARAVLYLSDVEGYSFSEIGGIVGCSEATARKRASRARNSLRGILSQEVLG
jgi:DNA-directed RNA polymerase specialized sigma24 family protein